jgi:hypothetical protein
MILNLLFNDFTSHERYLALQNKFASNDTNRHGMDEDLYAEVVADDFTVIIPSFDESNNPDFTTVSFYTDFISPKINSLAKTTIEKINRKIETDFLHNVAEREHYVKFTLHEFLGIGESLSPVEFLNPIFKDELLIQLEIVIDFLSNYNFNEEYKIVEKLHFNLNKTDLLVLIHLFRERGFLNNPYDAQLGFLIEKSFKYFNEKTKSFEDVLKAGRVINDIKNGSRPVNTSIERLKSILQDDAFYHL